MFRSFELHYRGYMFYLNIFTYISEDTSFLPLPVDSIFVKPFLWMKGSSISWGSHIRLNISNVVSYFLTYYSFMMELLLYQFSKSHFVLVTCNYLLAECPYSSNRSVSNMDCFYVQRCLCAAAYKREICITHRARINTEKLLEYST